MPVVTLKVTSSCVLYSKVNGNLTVKSIVLILPFTKHVDRIVQVTRKCLDNPSLSYTKSYTVSAALLSLLLISLPLVIFSSLTTRSS